MDPRQDCSGLRLARHTAAPKEKTIPKRRQEDDVHLDNLKAYRITYYVDQQSEDADGQMSSRDLAWG